MVQSRKNHSDSVKKSSFEKRSDCRPTGLSPMDGQSKNTRKKIVLICLVIATVLAFAITFAYALGSGEPAVATADEERTVEEGQAKKEDASNRAYISDVIQEQLAKAQAAKEQAQSDSNVIAVQDQEETDAFAIWARGRFAVTDLSGDKLFFEVDPEEDYTGIWTSLGVGGGLVVKGASELSDVTASGSITTKRALIATDISSVQAIFGNLQSSEATFDDVVMVKSDAGSLTAKAAVIESLVATDASAQKFEVKTVGVESLIADSISTEDLIANSADLETLFCPLACIDDLEAGVLSAKDLDVENLVAGHVSAQTVSGVWESWSLANPSSGSVVFPGIASDGSGFIASQEVTVPAGTTALFLQAGATGGDWVCAWGTRRVSETTWDICCRYPKGAYEEMAAGTFVPVEEVRVVWCALSVAP